MWMNGLGGSMFNNPETGRISIKNEFPFAINPSFHQYGALATGGFAVPGLPDWTNGRPGAPGDSGTITPTDKSIVAQLPGLPENPLWLVVFILSLLSSLIFVRIKYGDEESG